MGDTHQPVSIANEEHFEAVKELKSRLADFEWEEEEEEMNKLKNDFYLYQWLRTVKFNVDKAELAVRKSFVWRKKNGIATSTAHIPEEISKQFPIYLDYLSRTGTPVSSICGEPPWDIRGFVERDPDGVEKFVRYCSLLTLAGENIWLKHNQNIKRFFDPPKNWTYIYNTAYPNLSQATSPRTVKCAIQVLKDIAQNFPPMVDKIIYVNVSTIASIILKLIRPFLTFTKVEVYDRDSKKWKKALAEFIELEQLRPELGGSRTD